MPATTTSSADLASPIFASGAADAEVIRSLSLQPRILYATPEMSDFVKTGGLGEVAGALPRSLRRHYDVRVLIPGYRQVVDRFDHIPVVAHLRGHAGIPPCDLGLIETGDGLKVYIILNADLYQRDGTPYGDAQGDFRDNDLRFARLSLAAAELTGGVDPSWSADLLHLNDWQTALAPAYLEWTGQRVPSVLTIHNLAYQGLFPSDSLGRLGIPDGGLPDGWLRVLWASLLPQGWHLLRLACHHGE